MVKNDVFSIVGGLGGDFYKDVYETKLFGMHITSVLRGLNAGSANNDLKLSILPICRTYTGSTGSVFSMFGGLGGDFCKDIYEPKLFGMHIGSVLSGFDAENVNTDVQISIIGYGDAYD